MTGERRISMTEEDVSVTEGGVILNPSWAESGPFSCHFERRAKNLYFLKLKIDDLVI